MDAPLSGRAAWVELKAMETETTHLLLASLLPMVAVIPRMLGFMIGLQLLPDAIFPPLMRNAVAIAISLVAYPVAAADAALRADDYLWLTAILFKEGLIGLVLGYLLGLPMAMFESFGTLIDTQSGTNSAATFDPGAGHELGVSGALLRNLGATIIVSTGLFLAAVDIVLWSYKVWPISLALPPVLLVGAERSLPMFSAFMSKLLLLAFPVVFVMLALELAIGRINRSVPQLNVFTVAMPLKSVAASLMLIFELMFLLDDIVELLQFPNAMVRAWLGI